MTFALCVASLSSCLLTSCATTTSAGAVGINRKQLMWIPEDQVNSSAAQAYEQTKNEAQSKGTLDRNLEQLRRVQNISQRLIPHTRVFRDDAPAWPWEVHVITSKELNAYCMPGGKIMFYTEIIDALKLTDGEIAAVMGHEISHALREHGRERMSEEVAKQLGLEVAVMSGAVSEKSTQLINQAAAVVMTLPNSRRHETEADEMGVELMARAGYDPQEAIHLWQKMSKAGGQKPPEFLSTHPADETRIHRIEALLPKVTPLYQSTK